MRIAQSIFMSRDVELARRLVAVKVDVRRLEQESAERHIERIRQRRAESLETSTLHLDVLRDLKRINAHITSVAYPILDELGQLRESRLLPELQQPTLQAKTS
jgi:phosphate:Na+ symporter